MVFETTRYCFNRKAAMLPRKLQLVLLSCCMSLILSGCATTYPANPPLQQIDPGTG